MTFANPSLGADRVRLSLTCLDQTLSLQSFEASEGLNQPIILRATVKDVLPFSRDELMGAPASLRVTGSDGHPRTFHGVVDSARQRTLDRRHSLWTLHIHSKLCRGHEQTRARLFMQQSRADIVRQLLAEMGYERHEIDWRVSRDSVMPTPLLQAQESNYDFFCRLLSEAGWLFWSTAPAEGADHERLIVCDEPWFPDLDLPTLTVPRWTGDTGAPDINRLVDCTRHSVGTALGGHRTVLPSGEAPAERFQGRTPGSWSTFGPPLPEAATAHHLRLDQHRHPGVRHTVRITGHQPGLRHGGVLNLNANARFPDTTGHYTVLSVHHTGEQPSQDGQPGVVQYRNHAVLSARDVVVTPAESEPLVNRPHLFPATIESRDPHYAQMDRDGRYYLRARFDDGRAHAPDHARASPAIEVLAPYVSPLGEHDQPVGWHFPLLDQSTVLVGCLNSDPNRPVILGFTPNRRALGPVTAHNGSQYRLLTPSQNELTFDDAPGNPCIILQTFNGDLRLALNARDAEPYLRLATEYGALNVHIAEDLRVKAIDGDLNETVGQDRTQQVKQDSTTRVGASVQYQAGTRHYLTAQQHLTQTASGDFSLHAADDFSLTSGGATHHRAAQGYQVSVPDGAILSRVNGHVTLRSEGDIIITQGDAGIHMSPHGNRVRFFGNKITLKGKTAFNGNVSYEDGGNEAVAAPAVTDVAVPALPRLLAEGEPGVDRVAWSQPVIDANQSAPQALARFNTQFLDAGESVTVVVSRKHGGDTVTVDEIEHTLTQGTGLSSVGCPMDYLTPGPVPLEIAQSLGRDGMRFQVRGRDQSSRHSELLTVRRDVTVSLQTTDGVIPEGVALRLDDTEGNTHTLTLQQGQGVFEAIPLGRFRVQGHWQANDQGLAITHINGHHCPPDTSPWWRESDPGTYATELNLTVLRPAILLNLRDAAWAAGEPALLSDDELDYFQRHGNNATVFIHGYNVPLGEPGKGVLSVVRVRAGGGQSGRNRDATIDLHQTLAGTPTVMRHETDLRRAFPIDHYGGRWTSALALEDDLDPNRIDAGALNGEGAMGWRTAMEYHLNQAAGFDGEDYTQYARIVGVAWEGDLGQTRFWDCEMSAHKAGRRLVPVLRQLIDADINVNVITHSLGARVILTALNLLDDLEAGQIDQLILWQPAIDQTALSDAPDAGGMLGHEAFPGAHRAARHITVLHSEGDGVLNAHFGNSNDGRPDDAPTDGIDSALGFLSGAYPRKYGLGINIRSQYFDSLGQVFELLWSNSRAALNLRGRLQAEAERLNGLPSNPYAKLPEPELLLPWSFFGQFTPERIDQIVDWVITTATHAQYVGVDTVLRNVEASPISLFLPGPPRTRAVGYLPFVGHEALGWQWNEEVVNDSEALLNRTIDGELDEVDQTGILFSHSGMRVPSSRLFEEVFEDEILDRITRNSSFGSY